MDPSPFEYVDGEILHWFLATLCVLGIVAVGGAIIGAICQFNKFMKKHFEDWPF